MREARHHSDVAPVEGLLRRTGALEGLVHQVRVRELGRRAAQRDDDSHATEYVPRPARIGSVRVQKVKKCSDDDGLACPLGRPDPSVSVWVAASAQAAPSGSAQPPSAGTTSQCPSAPQAARTVSG